MWYNRLQVIHKKKPHSKSFQAKRVGKGQGRSLRLVSLKIL